MSGIKILGTSLTTGCNTKPIDIIRIDGRGGYIKKKHFLPAMRKCYSY